VLLLGPKLEKNTLRNAHAGASNLSSNERTVAMRVQGKIWDFLIRIARRSPALSKPEIRAQGKHVGLHFVERTTCRICTTDTSPLSLSCKQKKRFMKIPFCGTNTMTIAGQYRGRTKGGLVSCESACNRHWQQRSVDTSTANCRPPKPEFELTRDIFR
jgi:hypothetical protein